LLHRAEDCLRLMDEAEGLGPLYVSAATSADVALLKDLLRVFAKAFGEIDTYQDCVPSQEYLTRLLEKEHFIAIVALQGNEVVAGLAAYELDKFEQERREIYIYDLAVLEPHRRKGIATAMIGALRKIAAARNAHIIFVQADLDDGPAIALYESLGTKATAHHFDIDVRAPGRGETFVQKKAPLKKRGE
jgi:aminoglycoside 3-N-acetyltransferase I